MYWHNLEHKKIGVWGMGKEGQAAWKALSDHCPTAQLLTIEEANTSDILKCDILIKSPGISLYRSEIREAVQQGVIVTSGTNLFFANKKETTCVIAITGTKGKSTTSSLLAHTLKHLNQSVILGGNIGVPLLDLVDTNADYVVAEMSSYQCADLTGHPDIGVLLNLYPEHLQWHGTHKQYYNDKLNMIRLAKQPILNATNDQTSQLTSDIDAVYFNAQSRIHIKNGWFYNGGFPLFPISELPLPGLHNAEDACAVLTVIDILGLQPAACAEAFKTFHALPHRLQTIGCRNGITYIDDSISTTPETAIAALKAIDKGQPITLIAGGLDRGQDYTALVAYLAEHKDQMRLVTLPDTGTKLAHMAQTAGIETGITSEMPTAVNIAQHLTPNGGTILLSPAAPSYNLYTNFEERGDDFKHWAGL